MRIICVQLSHSPPQLMSSKCGLTTCDVVSNGIMYEGILILLSVGESGKRLACETELGELLIMSAVCVPGSVP